METVVLFIEVLVVSALCAAEPIKNVFVHCTLPLGMEEEKIPDDAITASSSYEMKSVGPQNARIRQEKNGGAWCPKAQISNDIREYLEIDLTKDHLITWTETQGRFGNGQGQEYAEAFFLEYWRGDKWHQYKSLKGSRVLRGNSNTYLEVKQKLDLPFVASRVRFVPYSQHPRTVCMRVEIYGCVWEQRVVKYSAPRGDMFGVCNLEDASYDGTELDGTMVDGLGQLVDGILGEAPESIVSASSSNWVGWRDRQVVELVFEFSEVRDFLSCSIHLAHWPNLETEVCSELNVWFSVDGKQYQPNPELMEITEEMNKSSVTVTIPLQLRSGRFIKLDLKPKRRWLLISEVTFEPVSGKQNISVERSNEYRKSDINETDTSEESEKSKSGFNETLFELNANVTPDAFPISNSQTYIGLVSGALTVVALFLTCTVFLMKQRGRNKVALLQKHTALLCGSSAPGITINMKDIKMATPIVVNGLSQSRLSIKSKGFSGDDNNTIRSSDNTTTSEYEHCSAYERTYKLFSEENLMYEPPSHKKDHFSSSKNEYADFTSEHNYEEENLKDRIATSLYSVKRAEHSQTSKSNRKIHEGYYAATDILTIKRREQQSNSSLFTSMQIQDSVKLSTSADSFNIQHVSRHRLRILDKLGEGSFGLVHLCEAKGIQSPDFNTVRNRQVVIVRSLWRGVTDSLRKDFMKDMYLLATIRDINIARIIALVEEEPFGAVFEYGELGDLPTFMSSRSEINEDLSLSYNSPLNFATQIASGMKYLESLNIPHCDLAARNCTVTKNIIIKVSDHAMYCSKYDQEYYVNGCYAKVPLRWMAWEAILLGKHSCHADVWSYAVTVWEIFEGCKELPYADLTSEQVLENYSKWYHASSNSAEKSQPRILSQPSTCSRDLYHMMTKCWNKHAEDRPTFEEIYRFLKRLGFD